MTEDALRQVLNQHFQSVALWVVVVNAFGIILNAAFAFILQRKLKRFESRLDTMAAEDKTRFEFYHGKSADAALDAYAKASGVIKQFTHLQYAEMYDVQTETNDAQGKRLKDSHALLDSVQVLQDFVASQGVVFEHEVIALVNDFCDYVIGTANESTAHSLDAAEHVEEAEGRLRHVQNALKKLVIPKTNKA